MTPPEEAASPRRARPRTVVGRSPVGRLAALGALIIIVITVGYLLFASGDGGNNYKLVFETGGQLVKGNQVLIGGQPVGTIDDVKLTDNAQAEVSVTVDRQLHEGTSAVIRSTSLSGIANRYISITPGPDNMPELADGGVITQVDTTAPVDLDQLFNTLREPERKALQDIIQGSAVVYGGADYEKGILTGAEDANETYKYLSPSLVATDRLLQELVRDEGVLTDFLVNGAGVVTAVAERRDDLSGLVSNSNKALGAIASQNHALDRSLVALPPALRQANTTFFNLRDALDDLDPLVNTSKTATKNLAPFLRQLQPVVKKSVPVFRDLRRATDRRGKSNDLADAAADLAPLESRAQRCHPGGGRGDAAGRSRAQVPPAVLAGHLQRGRRPQPSRRLLRRRRPLCPRGPRRAGDLQLHRRRPATSTRSPLTTSSATTARRHKLQGLPPLPGRRQPAPARRQQPVPRRRRAHQPGAPRRLHRDRRAPRAMRRILVIAAALLLAGLLIALPGATGAGSGGTYEVRAIFDNGAFVVPDEEVRVAGATWGRSSPWTSPATTRSSASRAAGIPTRARRSSSSTSRTAASRTSARTPAA